MWISTSKHWNISIRHCGYKKFKGVLIVANMIVKNLSVLQEWVYHCISRVLFDDFMIVKTLTAIVRKLKLITKKWVYYLVWRLWIKKLWKFSCMIKNKLSVRKTLGKRYRYWKYYNLAILLIVKTVTILVCRKTLH